MVYVLSAVGSRKGRGAMRLRRKTGRVREMNKNRMKEEECKRGVSRCGNVYTRGRTIGIDKKKKGKR